MRTVGSFEVHPLVDVSGALDTTNREAFPGATEEPVSYTHLTLPTN